MTPCEFMSNPRAVMVRARAQADVLLRMCNDMRVQAHDQPAVFGVVLEALERLHTRAVRVFTRAQHIMLFGPDYFAKEVL